jgi:hypothetical protein
MSGPTTLARSCTEFQGDGAHGGRQSMWCRRLTRQAVRPACRGVASEHVPPLGEPRRRHPPAPGSSPRGDAVVGLCAATKRATLTPSPLTYGRPERELAEAHGTRCPQALGGPHMGGVNLAAVGLVASGQPVMRTQTPRAARRSWARTWMTPATMGSASTRQCAARLTSGRSATSNRCARRGG